MNSSSPSPPSGISDPVQCSPSSRLAVIARAVVPWPSSLDGTPTTERRDHRQLAQKLFLSSALILPKKQARLGECGGSRWPGRRPGGSLSVSRRIADLVGDQLPKAHQQEQSTCSLRSTYAVVLGRGSRLCLFFLPHHPRTPYARDISRGPDTGKWPGSGHRRHTHTYTKTPGQ